MTLVLLPTKAADHEPGTEAWNQDNQTGLPAVCTAALAADTLARLRDDYLTTQVFLDLGRLFRPGRARTGLHERVLLSDLQRHTRLLPASLQRIGAAFAAAGGQGPLFVLSGDGALLLHPLTRLSIAAVCRAGRAPMTIAA